MFPFTGVPFWVPIFDPLPSNCFQGGGRAGRVLLLGGEGYPAGGCARGGRREIQQPAAFSVGQESLFGDPLPLLPPKVAVSLEEQATVFIRYSFIGKKLLEEQQNYLDPKLMFSFPATATAYRVKCV